MAARKRAPLSVVIDTDGHPEDVTTAQPSAGDVQAAEAASESETPAPAKKATRSPRKKSTATPAKKTTARKPAAKKPAAPAEPEAEPLRVKGVDTADAKRASLYLHPDDYRALQLAKLDDGADLNSRMRAMIALWQHNARFRAAVDRLAKDAPRGGSKF
ncbi:MAG: hypothetical protein ACRDPS_21975 [Nocardioides sp.]|uniref:hypothetical protein n=1 Tax=Nocardioides sp. TaxID=35761 RepID=UPI003D6AE748